MNKTSMNQSKFKFLLTSVALLGLVTAALPARAALVFDRGLPITNLNSSAGANRSNVDWSDWEPTADHSTFWLPGDDFTLAGSGAYNVNTIRVWSLDDTGLSLKGGLVSGLKALQSTTFTATPVTYANGQGYQGNLGGYSQIYQIDFSVDIAVNGGQTYQFFLDGPVAAYTGAQGGYVSSFLLASYLGKSGTTQQGADGSTQWLLPDGSVTTLVAETENSDMNVQVFATPVPEPATIGLVAIGLLGALTIRRRKV